MKNRPNVDRWDLQAYQDALRPLRDQKVEFALLATYSLDLPSLVSALLALARQDNDEATGSSVALVTAVNSLRGRFRVLCEKGRIQRPKNIRRMSPLLDQFVREISSEDVHSSWHPKAFLIKLTSNDQAHWRFWIGSKNLTRDEAWDLGLLLVSDPLHKGREVPGIVEAGIDMARRAQLGAIAVNTLGKELQGVSWQIPDGIKVEEVRWLDSESRSYPEVEEKVSKVFVVSPFLDSRTLKHFGSLGQNRLLLSLDCELSRIASGSPDALAGFHGGIHGMAKPSPAVDSVSAESDELNAPDTLHAKLFYMEAGKRRVLWVGSANATSRGLKGPNAEVVARLELSQEMASALERFILGQRVLEIKEIPEMIETPSDALKRRLEAFRNLFLNKYQLVQQVSPSNLQIVPTPPLEIPDEFTLRMGSLLGDLKDWPHKDDTLLLPTVELYQQSELVQVQIELNGEILSWLQTATLVPPLDETRDAALIRKNLSLQERLEFLRLTLGGVPSQEGRLWDDDSTSDRRTSRFPNWYSPLPTLEEVLKSDRTRLTVFSRYFRDYFDDQELTRSDLSTRQRTLLTDFQSMWRIAKTVLLPEEVD